MPTFRQDIKLGTDVPQMKTDDYNDQSVTAEKIKDGSISTQKLADGSVTTSKIADENVTTEKLEDAAVTFEKIGLREVRTANIAIKAITYNELDSAAVTKPKIADGAVVTTKIADAAVTADKIADKNITNQKMADDTLTLEKLSPELRNLLEAATGLSEDLIKTIQDVRDSLSKLNDAVYPITLSLNVSPETSSMETSFYFSVTRGGKTIVPDSLLLTKQTNDTTPFVYFDKPASSGSTITSIEGNREIFALSVTQSGTSKSTSVTRYLCYYGASTEATATADVLSALDKISTTGVSFNPTVKLTSDGSYIWFVVPSYLTIRNIKSDGFDVTLADVQTVTTDLGTFNAYRTKNDLTSGEYSFIIS